MNITDDGIITFSNPAPLKANAYILVTLFGISILCKEVQPLKALDPILFTLFGISMLCKEVQSSYLQVVLYQLLVC